MKLSVGLHLALSAALASAAPALNAHQNSKFTVFQPLTLSRANRPVNGGPVFSRNWSGAVQVAPKGDQITSVYASFKVPKPKHTGNSGTESAAAWIGIDGCGTKGLLQGGIVFDVDMHGKAGYWTGYEWYPDAFALFHSFPIEAGDEIEFTVVARSASSGTVIVNNKTKKKMTSKDLTAPNANSHIQGITAEWIVEDYFGGGGQVPFNNFGTVTFTGAGAKTMKNQQLDIKGSVLINIKHGSDQLTTTTINSDSSLTVKHT